MPRPGPVGTATKPSASIGMRSFTSVWLIGVSATQYSWNSASGQHGVHVQRRCLDDPALPRVRHGLDAVLARELADPQQLGDPAAARHVGLDEVDVAALDQLAEAPHRRVLLAGGDADVDGVGELGVRLVLVGLERLLEPEDAELLELARDADRRLRVGDVAVPGVDQDVAVAGGLLRSRGEAHVVLRILAERPPAELDRGEALRRGARRRAPPSPRSCRA